MSAGHSHKPHPSSSGPGMKVPRRPWTGVPGTHGAHTWPWIQHLGDSHTDACPATQPCSDLGNFLHEIRPWPGTMAASVTPAIGRQRQEGPEFQASPSCRVSSCTLGARMSPCNTNPASRAPWVTAGSAVPAPAPWGTGRHSQRSPSPAPAPNLSHTVGGGISAAHKSCHHPDIQDQMPRPHHGPRASPPRSSREKLRPRGETLEPLTLSPELRGAARLEGCDVYPARHVCQVRLGWHGSPRAPESRCCTLLTPRP